MTGEKSNDYVEFSAKIAINVEGRSYRFKLNITKACKIVPKIDIMKF